MDTRFTYYRQYFSIQLTHKTAPGIVCKAFTLQPDLKTAKLFLDKKMRYKAEPGKITVFYSGGPDPANVPPFNDDKMIPFPGVDNGTEFMFIINIANREIMKKTLMPSAATDPAFDIKKIGQAVPWSYIKPCTFNKVFDKIVSSKMFDQFTIKDAQNKIVITSDVRKNNEGNFQCSVDMSHYDSGFYSIELGTGKELFYMDSMSEMANKYGFIRVVKDNTWTEPKGIYDKTEFNIASYEFPKTIYELAM
jgi:hypothetical protein